MSSDPDFPLLLSSIARCNAVYDSDDQSARQHFSQLGSTVLGRYCDGGHQAVAHRDPDGWATLTICGTRVTEGSLREHSVDLFEDVDFSPHDIGEGVQESELVRVEGHSLGGQRTHLAPLFLPLTRLDRAIAWEPPKAANEAYYLKYSTAIERTITVLNGTDPWAAWPWICDVLVHPPGPILWLNNSGWSWTTRDAWPGGQILSASDHDVSQIELAVRCLATKTAS